MKVIMQNKIGFLKDGRFMKKVIGIALIILLFVGYWIGLSFVFYGGGLNLWLSIIIPPCCGIAVLLILGLTELIGWLLS